MIGTHSQRLIVVSNRLPIALDRTAEGEWESKPAAGGLVTALLPVLERVGGVWVGWPGTPATDSAGLKRHLRESTRRARYEYAPVALTRSDIDGYYHGFSNEVLWPLFHDWPTTRVFDPEYWQRYVQANRKFAHETAKIAERGDFVWVHDYHLMKVASELRTLGCENEIGFFLHIPFPAPDMYSKLPWRDDLLEALGSFDLLGFQTPRDRDNFLQCARRLLPGCEVVDDGSRRGIRVSRAQGAEESSTKRRAEPRIVRTESFPISIDYARFAERASGARVEELAAYLEEEAGRRRIILGVDRLDYSKGLPYKLAAFRRALVRHRALRKRVTLVQHVVPSREDVFEYRELRLEIERTVGEINGRFSAPGWVPVHYFYHTLNPDELCAYYRSADIALVTPLKDGMNLVAKEYCACRIHDDGVLILSDFAGAADELGSAALVVNPFDIAAVADAIRGAFLMEQEEQRGRMRELRRVVHDNDVYRWVESYLSTIRQFAVDNDEAQTSRVDETPVEAS